MSSQLKPPGEQLPTQANRPDNGQPQQIDTSKLSEDEKQWVLRAYNEREQFRREAESLRAERERYDTELRNREQLIATLAQARPQDGPDARGIVSREHTEPIARPETRPIEYDPWANDAQARLTAEVRRIAREEAEYGDRAISDWYLRDRQNVWNAVTQQDSLVMNYNVEIAKLIRSNPDLPIEEIPKLIEAAPRFGFSPSKAYEGLHPEVQRERLRSEVRQEVERELAAQTKAPPPAVPPPVLGHPTAVPRRRHTEIPKSYAEATRRAYEDAGAKLFE